MGRRRALTVEVGDTFGRLVVIQSEVPGRARRTIRVRCSCPAETEKMVQLASVTSGAVKSCGCLNRELAAERARARTLPPDERKQKYLKVTPKFLVNDEGRECSRCTTFKAWSSFNKGNGARGFTSWCKSCQQEHHGRTSLERRRELALARRLGTYSLTVQQYQALNNRYAGRCWRCKKFEVVKGPGGLVQRLSVDHDHACCPGDNSCGRCIRGLLCVGCNFVLGRIDGGQIDSYLVYLGRGYVDLNGE